MNILEAITLVAAGGCGLIGGCFFAFSTFVMKALRKLPPEQGIAAMQSINVVVINPWFLGPFLGTALLSIVLFARALFTWQASGSGFLAAGSVLYVVGTLFVTLAFNVPRNDALAKLTPTSPEAAAQWATYCAEWTAWNHVRTIAALAAAASLLVALRLRG